MSDIPEGQYYTKEHEWIRVEGDEVVIGITDHAQDALTDIVYIELPDAGEMCEEMGEFAIVESVKSASPIFAPLAGEITAVNEALDDAPELMNQDPYQSLHQHSIFLFPFALHPKVYYVILVHRPILPHHHSLYL